MTRVALYARYSSDNQREASIEDQLRICRERAKREKWKIVGADKDAGISGASVVLRPGIQIRLQDAQAGQFNIVLAEALDRISRDQADVATFLQTSEVRRRADHHAGRGRDQRTACRPREHDERAVPRGPCRQDPSRHPWSRRGGQVRRRTLLRLQCRQATGFSR